MLHEDMPLRVKFKWMGPILYTLRNITGIVSLLSLLCQEYPRRAAGKPGGVIGAAPVRLVR
jgi:hypothetical protein